VTDRFNKEPDIWLTPDEIAEALPHLAEYAYQTLPEPIIMMPSVIPHTGDATPDSS
jgi:hypothetical protein